MWKCWLIKIEILIGTNKFSVYCGINHAISWGNPPELKKEICWVRGCFMPVCRWQIVTPLFMNWL